MLQTISPGPVGMVQPAEGSMESSVGDGGGVMVKTLEAAEEGPWLVIWRVKRKQRE